MSILLVGERLILRHFSSQTSDLKALLEILGDEEVNTFLPWYPVRSLKKAREFYEERWAGRPYVFAVCLRTDLRPVGYICVDKHEPHDLGYGLHRRFWGQGLITEGCFLAIDELKRAGMPYLTATHDVNNPRSGAVMQRLGMRYQYSYEEQWLPKNFRVTFRLYLLNLDGNEKRQCLKYWQASDVHFFETL